MSDYKKKPIPNELRRAVFKRDGYVCRYCGMPTSHPHADHSYPEVKGGETTLQNLVTSCARCNVKKHARVGVWPLPIGGLQQQTRAYLALEEKHNALLDKHRRTLEKSKRELSKLESENAKKIQVIKLELQSEIDKLDKALKDNKAKYANQDRHYSVQSFSLAIIASLAMLALLMIAWPSVF